LHCVLVCVQRAERPARHQPQPWFLPCSRWCHFKQEGALGALVGRLRRTVRAARNITFGVPRLASEVSDRKGFHPGRLVCSPVSSCIIFGLVRASRCLPQQRLRTRYPSKDLQRICGTAHQEKAECFACPEVAWQGSLKGHLEKSALACRDWPARSVTASDFTPGRQEEAEFFEVPKSQAELSCRPGSRQRKRSKRPLMSCDRASSLSVE
jgi:hypothetical protein